MAKVSEIVRDGNRQKGEKENVLASLCVRERESE